MKTNYTEPAKKVTDSDRAAAFIAIPALDADGNVVDCAFMMLIRGSDDATSVARTDSKWPLLTVGADGSAVQTLVTVDVSDITWAD